MFGFNSVMAETLQSQEQDHEFCHLSIHDLDFVSAFTHTAGSVSTLGNFEGCQRGVLRQSADTAFFLGVCYCLLGQAFLL